jgi:aryl-alcohol dehydrogenase-like predicted oxidoreductase
MERRELAGVDVPVVGMGTWQTFDVRGPEEAKAHAVVGAALDAGVRVFDSSPMYGEAERVLAGALEGRRERALVATKVWARGAAEGRRQIEQALAWYGGRVDVYQIHNLVAWRDHLPLLERLRDEGRIGVVGVTHYAHSAFDDLAAALRTGRFAQVQLPYNALDRAAERTLLPLAADLGVGVTTWAQALLKWILADPRVHCAIPATRRPERMRENAAAGDPPFLDEDARTYVSRLAGSL